MASTQRIARLAPLLLLMCGSVIAQTAPRGHADSAFDKQFGDAFFDAFWAQYPEYGVGVGYHKYADRLAVPDAKAQTAELAFIKLWQTRLQRIDKQSLNDSRRADWALLDNQFASRRFEIEQVRGWQWDPSDYNVAEGFARILTTDYAPLDQRLRTVLKRLVNVPAYYIAAKQNITAPSREHTQLAMEQNRGALAVLSDGLQKQIDSSNLSAHERALFAERLAAARAAVADYIAWLQTLNEQLAQGGARSFRLGRDLYEQRFAFDIQTGDTAAGLYQRALQEKEQLHTRMAMLADML